MTMRMLANRFCWVEVLTFYTSLPKIVFLSGWVSGSLLSWGSTLPQGMYLHPPASVGYRTKLLCFKLPYQFALIYRNQQQPELYFFHFPDCTD